LDISNLLEEDNLLKIEEEEVHHLGAQELAVVDLVKEVTNK
jgi:hypothetical protein